MTFSKGVPSTSGYYWIRKHGRTEPCQVIQTDSPVPKGGKVRYGVRVLDGWINPTVNDRFSFDHPFVVDAEYSRIELPE